MFHIKSQNGIQKYAQYDVSRPRRISRYPWQLLTQGVLSEVGLASLRTVKLRQRRWVQNGDHRKV